VIKLYLLSTDTLKHITDFRTTPEFWPQSSIWQLSYTATFMSADSSCMPIEQLAKTNTVSTLSPGISTQCCRNCNKQLITQIAHITIIEEVENMGVNMGNYIIKQWSNLRKGHSVCFRWIKMLTDQVETWCCVTRINRCKGAFSNLVKSNHLLIDNV
jgi:hypothetical protein